MTIEINDGGTIVVGVDGSGGAKDALAWAVSLARAVDGEILAIHTVEPPVFIDGYSFMGGAVVESDWFVAWKGWVEESHAQMQAWCADLVPDDVRWRFETIEGDVRTLVERADRVEARAVVVGRRGRGELAELVLGSCSHRLMHHCDRPVVVVPARAVARAA